MRRGGSWTSLRHSMWLAMRSRAAIRRRSRIFTFSMSDIVTPSKHSCEIREPEALPDRDNNRMTKGDLGSNRQGAGAAQMKNILVGLAIIASLELMASQTMAQLRCDLLKLAQEYIAKQYPSFDASGLRPIISESANLWELTYELPRGTLGGVPTITIDKRSCTVVRAQHSQ